MAQQSFPLIGLANAFAGSPLAGMIFTIINAFQGKKLRDEARESAQGREDEARALFAERRGGVLSAFDTAADTALSQQRSLQSTLLSGFGELQDEVFGEFENLESIIDESGDQERLDIESTFTESRNTARADIAARGLSGATILPTVQQGIDREEADAVGRLNERVLGRRAEVQGQRLAATERLGTQRLSLESELGFGLSNLQADLALGRADLFSGLVADEIDFIVNGITEEAIPSSAGFFDLSFQAGR